MTSGTIRAVLLALGLLALALPARPAAAFWDPITGQCRPPPFEGTAEAVDGDTLSLTSPSGHATVLRLVGLDAPELYQECRDAQGPWDCGLEAKAALAALVDGRTLACQACGFEGDGAMTALCRDGETDVGVELVRSGFAASQAFFSNGLHAAEVAARAAGRGLWRGDWVHPQAWRDGVRLGDGPCQGCLTPR